ncbi:MAG: hypothetical protein RLO51_27075, partial [Thalassobaculum sp.]|uniref:hypothetical protein n=1 Tax=Thalassobaculum sp. TaxID=2022740 RepID=UPI0032EC0C73
SRSRLLAQPLRDDEVRGGSGRETGQILPTFVIPEGTRERPAPEPTRRTSGSSTNRAGSAYSRQNRREDMP